MKYTYSIGKLIIFRIKSTWTGLDNEEIALCRNLKGDFFLKGRPSRKQKFPDFTPNRNKIKKVSVTEEWVSGIFEHLSSSRISAFPMPDMGADGSFTELEIGGYSGKAHYRWWSTAPDSWGILEETAEKIYKKFYTDSECE